MRELFICLLVVASISTANSQIAPVAYMGASKQDVKTMLDKSTFVTKIEEKTTKDGTPYYWCETRNTYVLAYNFDGYGKCFQFSIMDNPETEATWRSLLNDEFTIVETDIWKDERQSPTIYWRLVLRKEAVWTQASYKNPLAH